MRVAVHTHLNLPLFYLSRLRLNIHTQDQPKVKVIILFQMLTIPSKESISFSLSRTWPTVVGNYLSTLTMTDFATIKKQQKTNHFIVFFYSCRKLPWRVQTVYLKGYWLLHYFSSLYKGTNIILVLREPGRERGRNQRVFKRFMLEIKSVTVMCTKTNSGLIHFITFVV